MSLLQIWGLTRNPQHSRRGVPKTARNLTTNAALGAGSSLASNSNHIRFYSPKCHSRVSVCVSPGEFTGAPFGVACMLAWFFDGPISPPLSYDLGGKVTAWLQPTVTVGLPHFQPLHLREFGMPNQKANGRASEGTNENEQDNTKRLVQVTESSISS